MNKTNLNVFVYFFFIIIGLFYILILETSFYPDYSVIFNKFLDMENNSLRNSMQFFIFENVKEFFQLKIDKISFSLFFLVNIFFILILISIQSLISNDKKNHSNYFLLLLSFCFPSALISIVTPSSESIHVIVSIFVMFMIMNRKYNLIFLVILLIYGLFLDIGNSIVFLSFLSLALLMIVIKNFINIKASILIASAIIILLTYFGREIILTISLIFDWEVGKAMINNVYINKLGDIQLIEIFKRYVYFWLTLTGIMNHFKELIFLILPIIFILLVNIYRETTENWVKVKDYFSDPLIIIIIFLVIFFPLLIISILPTHAFCKYYLFIIPVLMKFLFIITQQSKIYYFIPITSVLYLINTSFI